MLARSTVLPAPSRRAIATPIAPAPTNARASASLSLGLGLMSSVPSVRRSVGSSVEHLHLLLVVMVTRRGGQLVEPVELLGTQLDAVGGNVLLDPGDALRARDGSDEVTSGDDPGEGDLSRGDTQFGGDRLDFVGDAQVVLEVLAHEARAGLAPVIFCEIVQRSDVPGEEAVAERRIRDE